MSVTVGQIPIGSGAPLVLIAGPCVVESADFMVQHALRLEAIAADAEIPLIFKASYDKANRTSVSGRRGPGLDEGLDILLGLWSGGPFTYRGRYYQIENALFLPRPVQRPRIPIWVGAKWRNRAPLRRAAKWDGVFPVPHDDEPITPEDL